jgi:hypothetical protein
VWQRMPKECRCRSMSKTPRQKNKDANKDHQRNGCTVAPGHAMLSRMPPGVSLARCLPDRPRGFARAAPIGPETPTSGWGTKVPIISHVVDIRRVAFLWSLDRPVLPSTPVEDEWVVWGCAVRSTPVACAANPQSGQIFCHRVGWKSGEDVE